MNNDPMEQAMTLEIKPIRHGCAIDDESIARRRRMFVAMARHAQQERAKDRADSATWKRDIEEESHGRNA